MSSRKRKNHSKRSIQDESEYRDRRLLNQIPEAVRNHIGSRYVHNNKSDRALVLRSKRFFQNVPEDEEKLSESVQLWRISDDLHSELKKRNEIVGNINRTQVWIRDPEDSREASLMESIVSEGDLSERSERFEKSKEKKMLRSHKKVQETEINPRIWVGDVDTRDQGEPHGEWIFKLKDPEQVQREIERILDESPAGGREFYIGDAEGFGDSLSLLAPLDKLNTSSELKKLSVIARGLSQYGRPFAEYAQLLGTAGVEDPAKALRDFKDAYYGQYETRVDCARDYLQATGSWRENPNTDPLDYAYELFDESAGSGFMISKSGYVFYEHV